MTLRMTLMEMPYSLPWIGTQVPATLLSIVTSDITKRVWENRGHLLVDGTLDDPFVHTLLSLDKVGFEIPFVGS